jgi:hypothetical protein
MLVDHAGMTGATFLRSSTRYFQIDRPGDYVARFSYRYSGDDRGKPSTFHGLVQSEEVMFDAK